MLSVGAFSSLTSSSAGTDAEGKGVRASGVEGNWNGNQGGTSRTERPEIVCNNHIPIPRILDCSRAIWRYPKSVLSCNALLAATFYHQYIIHGRRFISNRILVSINHLDFNSQPIRQYNMPTTAVFINLNNPGLDPIF